MQPAAARDWCRSWNACGFANRKWETGRSTLSRGLPTTTEEFASSLFFRRHIDHGGRVVAIFGGNARQRLTSRQVVQEMLECGADVHVVNRKRLMHAKSYGSRTPEGEMLVVTSGNFTGPGMAQNVEMSLMLDRPTTRSLGFLLGELW